MDIADDTVARRGGGASAAPPRGAGPAARDSGPAATDSTAFNGAPAPRSAAAPRPTFSQLIDDIRAAFGARFYLLELEAKRAAWSAAYMLAFAVGAALLGVTAWLILIGALIFGAVAAGVPWVLAVIVAVALHAGAAFLLVRRITSMVNNLSFAATRRTLSRSDHRKSQDGSGA